ncbi:hypothetical protein AN644_01785 [Candidatus Epulonipiscium fishelsonii]|nr:hypothetical protein AN644_01785 [Epulopiscium sp. SCG-C06WGA-EpuloA1]
MLLIENITEILKCKEKGGYKIIFDDGRFIRINKRRTIISLLLLIKYEYCSEADLAGANDRLHTIKTLLTGKINPMWIQDRYGDANKPFSELWTEEGFSCIRAEGMKGNRQYVLNPSDHELLFQPSAKSSRIGLSNKIKSEVLNLQNCKCNICGAGLKNGNLPPHIFSKDRVKLEFDHRVPIDRGGKTSIENIQALCHYCNKSKRQICFICNINPCSFDCALVSPETSYIVTPTNEDISDRIAKK